MADSGGRSAIVNWRARGVIAIPLALMAVIFGLAVYLEFHERDVFLESRNLVIHSHTVVEAVQTLFSQVQDAESGQRGYLLTHDRDFLGPYERAVQSLPGSMSVLRDSVKGDADQPARVDLLDRLVQAKLDELAKTIAVASDNRTVQAQALLASNVGKVSMEQIRLAVANLIAEEKLLLEQRRVSYEAQRIRTFRIIIAACLVAMIGLGWAFWALISGARTLERRIAERDEAEAARRGSDALYRAMFTHAADHLFVMDTPPDGRLIWADVNPAWEAAVDRSMSGTSLRGRTLEETFPARVAKRLRDNIAQVVAAGAPLAFMENVDTEAGVKVWETILAPVFDQGQIVRIIGCTRDVSARAQAEEQIRRAQRMEAIGQLTGGVAHDFNNLLQVIRANLELLAVRLVDDEVSTQRLKGALHGADRAAQLTRQLLAFARRQPLEPRVVNLGKLIDDMSDLLRRSVGEAIAVETTIGTGLWNTLVDPAQVESALLNLALNARDAMTKGGRLVLELSNANLEEADVQNLEDLEPGQYVLLTMADTGLGMPPEVLSHVFEPFFTTKGEENGTGLGLSMVYGFVKQSRGHVQVSSELGRGTTVKMLLPRSLASEERSIEAPACGAGRIDTVLVVEDEPAVRAAACAMLQELGYQCLEASDGSSALKLLEHGAEVQLLFTDMVMPGPVKSIALAARARELHPDLPILFTSGYAQSAVTSGGGLAPGSQLLSKPYSRASLAAKIQAAIQAVQAVVLVVEDDPLVRLSAIDMVEDLGFQTVAAGDARQALELLRASGRIDILFTDVGLPDMNGHELADAALALRPQLAVVFASGYAGDGSTDAGAVWLSKPYELRELAQALGGLMKRTPPILAPPVPATY